MLLVDLSGKETERDGFIVFIENLKRDFEGFCKTYPWMAEAGLEVILKAEESALNAYTDSNRKWSELRNEGWDRLLLHHASKNGGGKGLNSISFLSDK
jgi:hypothetical protein